TPDVSLDVYRRCPCGGGALRIPVPGRSAVPVVAQHEALESSGGTGHSVASARSHLWRLLSLQRVLLPAELGYAEGRFPFDRRAKSSHRCLWGPGSRPPVYELLIYREHPSLAWVSAVSGEEPPFFRIRSVSHGLHPPARSVRV